MTGDDRIHPYFAAELTDLLREWDAVVRGEYEPDEPPSPLSAQVEYIVARLEFHGWKVEPSRQRRMQLDPPVTPPPPLEPL